MTGILEKIRRHPKRETLTEAYEVRAFRDDVEQQQRVIETEPRIQEAAHAEAVELQTAKDTLEGHGEQRIVPDDCQFGDNDLCNAEE